MRKKYIMNAMEEIVNMIEEAGGIDIPETGRDSIAAIINDAVDSIILHSEQIDLPISQVDVIDPRDDVDYIPPVDVNFTPYANTVKERTKYVTLNTSTSAEEIWAMKTFIINDVPLGQPLSVTIPDLASLVAEYATQQTAKLRDLLDDAITTIGDVEKHTPGPWMWHINMKMKSWHLCTTHSGRIYVMGANRWGMQQTKPHFQSLGEHCLIEPIDNFVMPDHNGEAFEINHPDARLIASAPKLYKTIKAICTILKESE